MKEQTPLPILFLLVSVAASLAAVMEIDEGMWPEDWPAAMDPLRQASRTIEVATGLQESVYVIPFDERADFEKYWPTIRKLLKPGSKLILRPRKGKGPAMVSIAAPSDGGPSKGPKVGPPWPKSAYDEDGVLVEYVMVDEVDGEETWVPADEANRTGFFYRARVDIELSVDGKVIDLSRIQLPERVVIEDEDSLRKKATLLSSRPRTKPD